MAIRTSTVTTLRQLADIVGSNTVTTQQIADFASSNSIEATTLAASVRRYATLVSRGVFDLTPVFTPEEAPVVAKTPLAVAVGDNGTPANVVVPVVAATPVSASVINFVPSVRSDFVIHGEYDTVKTIVNSRQFLPLYIVGESGNGKTLSVEQACAASGRELIIVNITNETTEDDLIGSLSLRDGNIIWVDGPVLTAARRGAILLLDEVDQASSRILAIQHILNGASEYYIKRTGEVVHIHPEFNVIATANTKGDGEGSDRYFGAGIINEAFLERFSAVVEQDYPSEVVERKILGNHLEAAGKDLINKLVRFASATRVAYIERAINNHITTRRLVHIAKNLQLFGDAEKAIRLAVSRFDSSTRDALIELWVASNKQEEAVVGVALETPQPETETNIPF